QLREMPQIQTDAAVLRSRALDKLQSLFHRVDVAEWHQFKADWCAVVGPVSTERRERLDHSRHGGICFEKMPHFDVMRAQNVGSFQKFLAFDVRCFLLFSIEKPAAEKFKLQMPDAVVVKDFLHLFQAALLQRVLQVRVPDSDAFETHASNRFDPLLEIHGAEFMVGVRLGAHRQRPIRSQQLDILIHFVMAPIKRARNARAACYAQRWSASTKQYSPALQMNPSDVIL